MAGKAKPKMKNKEDWPVLADWLTCSQAADELKISRQSVNRMVSDGQFKSVHLLGERPIYVVSSSEVSDLKYSRAMDKVDADLAKEAKVAKAEKQKEPVS